MNVKNDSLKYPAHSSKGFTLIEILVAVALTSIILAALYSTFFSVLRAQSAIDKGLERTRGVSRFLETFSKEIKSSFYKENNPITNFTGEKNDRNGKTLSRVTLTTFTYPLLKEGRPTGDLIAVRYSVEEDRDKKMTLYKETWNPYAKDDRKNVFKAEVLEDIDGFEISYFNGKDWAKAWDARLDKKLPDAVKASISVRDKGDVKEFTTIAQTMIR